MPVWSTPNLGQTWTRVCVDCFPARAYHTSSVDMTTNTLVVTSGLALAGRDGSAPTTCHNDVWSSTDSGVTWTRVAASAPFKRRYGATSFWRSGVVYVMGGLTIGTGGVVPVNDLSVSHCKHAVQAAVDVALQRCVRRRCGSRGGCCWR